MSFINHPNYIFFISHYLDPFFLYCLSKNIWVPIVVITLWELIEFTIFEIFGNYSALFLEGDDGELESFTDIFIFDILGGTMSVLVGYLFFKYYNYDKVILNYKSLFSDLKEIFKALKVM